MTETSPTFEQALAELEAVVRRLEKGDVPLDEALTLFEHGIGLSRACHSRLAAAENRVAQLTRGSQGIDETPLDEPDGDQGSFGF